MKTTCFTPADILLPDFKKHDGHSWSCVACDQYTAEPDYWSDIGPSSNLGLSGRGAAPAPRLNPS